MHQRQPARNRRETEVAPQRLPAGGLQRLQATVGNRGMQQLLGGVRGLLGEGAPLPDALRVQAEARFGMDFSGVRIHDHEAALAQRQLAHVVQQALPGPAARAGRMHEDAADQAASALGRGGAGLIDAGPAAKVGVQCTPLSEDEVLNLTLAQVRARLADNEGEASFSQVASVEYNDRLAQENLQLKARAAALMREGAPGQPVTSTAQPPVPARAQVGASQVQSLTNEELIAAMAIGPGRGSSLLEREQERRVRLGHKWLEETWESAPIRLIQIVPKDPASAVLVADMVLALGPATDIRSKPILSERQFNAFLAAHDIPSMTPKEYLAARAGRGGTLGALGGDAHLQGVQAAEARAFSRSTGTTWVGQRAEYGQMSHPLFGDLLYYDYNNRGWVDRRGGANVLHLAAERNFPIVDLRSRQTGAHQQLKTSTQDPSGRNRYYAEGLGDLVGGRRPDLFATMLQNLPGGPASAADFLASAQLLIPPDDVPAFQSLLANPTAPITTKGRLPLYRLQSCTPIFDGLLAADPVRLTPGGPQYNSVAALDAAVAANVLTQAQMDAVLQQRGQRAAGMVAAHTEAVTDLRADITLRSRSGSPASTMRIVGPEYLASARYARQYGSWSAGVSAGALGAAPRGGAGGALIAVITDTGIMLFDGRDNPEAVERLGRSAGYGFLGGTTGAATEYALQAQIQRLMVAQTLAGGTPTAVRSTLLRGAGGAAGGGVASIAVETWQIATEDGPHSGEEIALREGRALVIGASSGFLATVAGTAATGALAGTVVPGVGNAVGLVVGLLVGIGVSLAMEAAVPRPKRTGE